MQSSDKQPLPANQKPNLQTGVGVQKKAGNKNVTGLLV